MIPWKVWIAVSALLAFGELLLVGRAPGAFYMGSLIVGAIAAAIASALGLGWVGDVSVFIGASVVSLVMLRPIVRQHYLAEAEANRAREEEKDEPR